MRPALITVLASLLAVALVVPAADAATQVRRVQIDVDARPQTTPPTTAGRLSLDFVFKNKRGNKTKFTPRQLTLIDFWEVPLSCNSTPSSTSQLLLTTTLETRIKLKKTPNPSGKKPKIGRYAFNYVYSFPAFTGTISGKIDKVNGRGDPRALGSFKIEDLDSDPGHMNCSTSGPVQWGGRPLPGA